MYDFLSLIACRTQIFRIDIGCQGRHPECLCAIRVYNATCIVMYLYAEYIYIYIYIGFVYLWQKMMVFEKWSEETLLSLKHTICNFIQILLW